MGSEGCSLDCFLTCFREIMSLSMECSPVSLILLVLLIFQLPMGTVSSWHCLKLLRYSPARKFEPWFHGQNWIFPDRYVTYGPYIECRITTASLSIPDAPRRIRRWVVAQWTRQRRQTRFILVWPTPHILKFCLRRPTTESHGGNRKWQSRNSVGEDFVPCHQLAMRFQLGYVQGNICFWYHVGVLIWIWKGKCIFIAFGSWYVLLLDNITIFFDKTRSKLTKFAPSIGSPCPSIFGFPLQALEVVTECPWVQSLPVVVYGCCCTYGHCPELVLF